jgi:glycosyltransferase involved in cell wall biosynthesis
LAHEVQVDFENRILVSDQELQAAMAEAACFLYTSHLEPFGLTPLEANACGTAVVAIAEGGVRETIIPGINGWLAADNNSIELAELIMKFTTNLNHAEKVGAQAREHVIKYWSTTSAIDRLEQQLIDISC